jgi:hypothetical protein
MAAIAAGAITAAIAPDPGLKPAFRQAEEWLALGGALYYPSRGQGEVQLAEGKPNGPKDRLKRQTPRAKASGRGHGTSRYFKRLEWLALQRGLLYHRRRTGGRVVDGTALEMRRTCKGSVGSNPTLSAILP